MKWGYHYLRKPPYIYVGRYIDTDNENRNVYSMYILNIYIYQSNPKPTKLLKLPNWIEGRTMFSHTTCSMNDWDDLHFEVVKSRQVPKKHGPYSQLGFVDEYSWWYPTRWPLLVIDGVITPIPYKWVTEVITVKSYNPYKWSYNPTDNW